MGLSRNRRGDAVGTGCNQTRGESSGILLELVGYLKEGNWAIVRCELKPLWQRLDIPIDAG